MSWGRNLRCHRFYREREMLLRSVYVLQGLSPLWVGPRQKGRFLRLPFGKQICKMNKNNVGYNTFIKGHIKGAMEKLYGLGPVVG